MQYVNGRFRRTATSPLADASQSSALRRPPQFLRSAALRRSCSLQSLRVLQLCNSASLPTKCGLGAPGRLTMRFPVTARTAQCVTRAVQNVTHILSTAMVYQKGCGNRLLRGTGRPRGNLCPRDARLPGNLEETLQGQNGRAREREKNQQEKIKQMRWRR
jgi:hypothetical protein